MYRQFYQQLVNAVGNGPAQWLCLAAPGVIFLAVVVLCTRVWQRRLASAEEGAGWRGFLAAALSASLQVSAGVLGVGFLALMLLVQAGLYSERHGRVTQRNLEAVRSKWGMSQTQSELNVNHTVWELATEEDFAGGGKRRVTEAAPRAPADGAEEEVLSDETFAPELTDDGKPKSPLAVARRVKKITRKQVTEDAITAGEIALDLRNCPRFLGGAGYAGYELTGRFLYTVVNPTSHPTQACFSFPLPNQGGGFYNRLTVKMDGAEVTKDLRFAEGSLSWERTMAGGQQAQIEVGYESRGLEFFRYCPANFRQSYAVQMRVRGIPPNRLNFPIGSMSPSDDLAKLSGEDYTLHWDLSRSVTNFDMGIIVPAPAQPGVEVSRLLREAPLGLALLAFLLIVARLILGAELGFLPMGLSLVLHTLAYILLANSDGWLLNFWLAFAAATAVPALAGASFWRRFDAGQQAGDVCATLHIIFTCVYPLAVVLEPESSGLLSVIYVLLAIKFMLLFLKTRDAARKTPAPAASASATAG